jgi:uncharacterized protein YyaL (SSP411 family)
MGSGVGISEDGEGAGKRNRLAGEASPYLLQHAGNPVDWYPWGEEAFAKARKEEKPILLSIGYSTCHWCHVMERESFEDKEVAAYLNKHFVSIKLDREERPDVDAVYMKSFQALMGQGGGWPLNVFLTPDLEMFFGGTYFPPEARGGRASFQQVLTGVHDAWKNKRDEVKATGKRLHEELGKVLDQEAGDGGELGPGEVRKARALLADSIDTGEGGWGRGPKFPQPSHLMLLLTSGKKSDRDLALMTCRKMADGGIHDQLGGGFHRYAVDRVWLVPHFEKMLYDQAQLLEIYVEAWRQTGDDRFATVAHGIARYVMREMQGKEGGYFSAQDAQSDGKEGKYWCWTTKELEEVLTTEELAEVVRVFGLTPAGNFLDHSDPEALKNQNVLSRVAEVKDREVFAAAVKKMQAVRAKRNPPMTDDKVLSGWNGLMIAAMATAGRVLGEAAYLSSAEKAWSCVNGKLWDGKRLANRWRAGDIEDSQQALNYLAMARAGRVLYSATLDKSYLERGSAFLDGARKRFFDAGKGGFFDGEKRDDLVMRIKEDYDSAIPTASSLGCLELVLFAEITGRKDYRGDAGKTLAYYAGTLRKEPTSLPGLMRALEISEEKPARLLLTGEGEKREAFLKAGWRKGGAGLLVIGEGVDTTGIVLPTEKAEEATAYYCVGMTCRPPTTSVEKLLEYLEE